MDKLNRKRVGGQAFTLIELLVVIAIIAILAAILFPVFAQAREKARQTACLSDLKQIGLGITQYEQDYDEMTPCGYKTTGGGGGWAGQIYSYVKSEKVYTCPSDPSKRPTCSYAYNANLAALVNGVPNTQTGTLISKMIQPSRTILLCEVINSGQNLTYSISGEQALAAQGLATSQPQGHASPTAIGVGKNYDPGGADGGMTDADVAAAVAAGQTYAMYATGVPKGAYTVNTVRFKDLLGSHQEGACYLFADNHAKWLKPGMIEAGTTNDLDPSRVCGFTPWYMAKSFSCSDQSFTGTYSYQ
ncbi:MAG TPA: DUF1559 domain-containing protein [Capsulimonadaceae bacterium]|jgi:prepilin-type N-terminal cleavage/methylation domain-containing protein